MIKWLYPGMNVKRWLLLLAVGVVCFSLAIAMGLAWVYRNVDFPPEFTDLVQTLTLQFIPHPYRELVIGIPGLLVLLYAIFRLSQSILTAVLPAEPAGQRLSLVDRVYNARYAKRGPRIVAIGGGTGLSTMLRGLKKYSGNITAILTVGDDVRAMAFRVDRVADLDRQAIRESVIERFSVERMTDGYEAIYRERLAASPTAATGTTTAAGEPRASADGAEAASASS